MMSVTTKTTDHGRHEQHHTGDGESVRGSGAVAPHCLRHNIQEGGRRSADLPRAP